MLRDFILFTSTLLVCILIFGSLAVATTFFSQRQKDVAHNLVSRTNEVANPSDSFNLLFAVGNKNDSPMELMLFRLDAQSRRMAVMPVPMELKVEYGGGTTTLADVLKQSGIRETQEKLKSCGVKTDFYCIIRPGNLPKLLELFGSVNYTVPADIACSVPGQNESADITEGSQSFGGSGVLSLICCTGDPRYSVQAGIMKAFVRQKFSGYYLEHAQDLFQNAFDLVETDFSMDDLITRLRTMKIVSSQSTDFTVSVVPECVDGAFSKQTRELIVRYFAQ